MFEKERESERWRASEREIEREEGAGSEAREVSCPGVANTYVCSLASGPVKSSQVRFQLCGRYPFSGEGVIFDPQQGVGPYGCPTVFFLLK